MILFNIKGKPIRSYYAQPAYRVMLLIYSLYVECREDLANLLKSRQKAATERVRQWLLTRKGDGQQARHLCECTSRKPRVCIRVDHLVWGTQEQNEVDKHFSYFLHNKDPTLRAAATKAFTSGGVLHDSYKAIYKQDLNDHNGFVQFVNDCIA